MVVKKTGIDFPKPETGMQQAVCSHIYDTGIQETTYKGELKHVHRCIVLWELEERIKQGDYKGQRFVISKFYTASLNEKANLRKDLESWRGRAFTEKELEGFDLDNIKRANCYLNLVETKNDNGDTKIKVGAVVPFKKKENGHEPMTPELPEDYCPDWIKQIMEKATKEQPQASQPDTSGIEQNDEIPF